LGSTVNGPPIAPDIICCIIAIMLPDPAASIDAGGATASARAPERKRLVVSERPVEIQI
jgi:hypothetical protein